MTNSTPHGQVPEALRTQQPAPAGATQDDGIVARRAKYLRNDTDAGRAYVAQYLRSMGQHYFDDYIQTDLAGDFACALAASLSLSTPQPAPATQQAQQQEAQEPVAVVVPCYTPSGKRVALYSAKQDLPIGTQLYTAPQPSPTAQAAESVGRDAERYRWLRESEDADSLIKSDCRGVFLPQRQALDAAIDAVLFTTPAQRCEIAGDGKPCNNDHDPDCRWPDCLCRTREALAANGGNK